MAEQGILADKFRDFGVESPKGSRWYNFDPCTFLECATTGTFGGWEPGDETGRRFVQGPVAVLTEDGTLRDADPREEEREVVPLPGVTWKVFWNFLGAGQWYE
jgi:hypothetical protein